MQDIFAQGLDVLQNILSIIVKLKAMGKDLFDRASVNGVWPKEKENNGGLTRVFFIRMIRQKPQIST